MNKIRQIDTRWVFALILLLSVSRLIPHPPNFTPLATMAILSGCLSSQLRTGLVIPLAALLLSDVLLGLHSSMVFVYGAFVIITLSCRWLLTKLTISSVSLSVIWATAVFFLISNFGAWLSHDMYPSTMAGLGMAYIAGLPFLVNSLAGNIFFMLISIFALNKMSSADRYVNSSRLG